MSLFGGDKKTKNEDRKSWADGWLKEGENILGEFGECSASIGLEQAKNVGTVSASNDVGFGRVVVTNKRILFFGKSGLFGQNTRDEEPGNEVTKFLSHAYVPNNKGLQMYFDVPAIRKIISGLRPADGKTKWKYGFTPVTLVTDVKWVEKGFLGKQQIGMHIAAFIPAAMEAIKKREDLEEKLSNKKGLFAGMERGLIRARESQIKDHPFGNFILFVKFKNQEMATLNKFVQLLSDKTSAMETYRSNEAAVKKDYFHQ
jgi:hypothetical protein